ncbi:Imm52 family immunity protein [Saccharomonospora sp. NPDC046836]|uniref:Imm52 family immunity protein n=1 Tax=Saccharomonospora sp. NPDC046836 TaxID=3156921 RepID=UPI0033D34245
MLGRFHLGAYWGSRAESVEDCADKLARCLSGLRAADPLFADWFKLGKSKEDALKFRIDTSRQGLSRLLREGRDVLTLNNGEVHELGCSRSLERERTFRLVQYSLLCRGFPNPNVYLLKFPPLEESFELHRAVLVKQIFETVVDIWGPEWAIFATSKRRDWQGEYTGQPQAGWLTYIADREIAQIEPTPGIERVQLRSGVMIAAGADPLRVTPDHIHAVSAILRSFETE